MRWRSADRRSTHTAFVTHLRPPPPPQNARLHAEAMLDAERHGSSGEAAQLQQDLRARQGEVGAASLRAGLAEEEHMGRGGARRPHRHRASCHWARASRPQRLCCLCETCRALWSETHGA
jgi:hypothetical protein